MANKFKPGDKVINTGGFINLGVVGEVIAVSGNAGFTDAPDCDLLVQAEGAVMLQGKDDLWKQNRFYTRSSHWSGIDD